MTKNEITEKAQQIIKNKISANDARPNYKMKIVAIYMLKVRSYRSSRVKAKIKEISENYFVGLSQDYINDAVDGIICSVRNESIKLEDDDKSENAKVVIFEEELDQIRTLKDLNAEKLAFVFLVYSKRRENKWQNECNPEIIEKAHLKISGATQTKLIQKLTKAGMIKFAVHGNKYYITDQTQKIAYLQFCVPFRQETGTAAFEITNFAEDVLILYYLRYIGDDTIATCKCGCPIVKTSNRKKYCGYCAKASKQDSNKKQTIRSSMT